MPPTAQNMGGTGKQPGKQKQPDNQKTQQPTSADAVASDDALEEGERRGSAPATALTTASVSGKEAKRRPVARMDRYASNSSASKEFFKKEPCLFSHRIYDRASKIFEGLVRAKEAQQKARENRRIGGAAPGGGRAGKAAPSVQQEDQVMPSLDFTGPGEKKLTFDLAFSSMTYQSVFEEMLDDVAFYSLYSKLRDKWAMVMVVLYDYQSRKFQRRVPFVGETLDEDILAIENCIMDQKTKLSASLARRRIKAAAPNIEFLLPETVRKQTTTQRPMPAYAWVNVMKIHPAEMLQKLREDGFTQLWNFPTNTSDFKEKSFHADPHCSDVIVFSMDCNSILQEYSMVEQGFLVRQDKSSCLAAHCVVPLISDEQDVIIANPGSGFTPAHVAVLLKDRKCSVIAVTDANDDDYNKMLRNFELLGVSKYVKVLREPFMGLDPDDARLKNVRAALVMAECTKTAISNIVNFVVTEGENLKLLQDMSDQTDDIEDRLNRFQADHINVLRQALKLNRMNGVAYVTRSVHQQENDAVVQKATEFVNMLQMPKKLQPWRVIPPVIPYSSEEIDEQIGIEGKYVHFKPTTIMNGCFITALAREPETLEEMMARSSRSKNKGKGKEGERNNSASGDGPRKRAVAKKTKASSSRKSSAKPTSSGSSVKTPDKVTMPAGGPEKLPAHLKVVKHPAPFR